MSRDRRCLAECDRSFSCRRKHENDTEVPWICDDHHGAKNFRTSSGSVTNRLLILVVKSCKTTSGKLSGPRSVPGVWGKLTNAGNPSKCLRCRRGSSSIIFFWVILTALRLEWSMSLSAAPIDWAGGLNGLVVPDNMKTINKAVEMARSPDSIVIKAGDHKIGDHKIKAGLFHNNEACYWEPELEINKQLELHGLPGASLAGMLILQQPVDIETWRPVMGGGLLDGLLLSHKDLEGLNGFCVAVEGGRWVIEDCQIRCCGKFSKAIWVYGGEYIFDDSFKGGGKMVEKHDGADAVLRRCTVGGVCDGGVGGRAGWGAMVWQLSALSAEDCRFEECELIGVSACHGSQVVLQDSSVEACGVGAVMINDEALVDIRGCTLRAGPAASALVAGNCAHGASMSLAHSRVLGRPWHAEWGGVVAEADEADGQQEGDGLPLFLGTWTDRGRIKDPDPDDVVRYIRRVRKNNWSREPLRPSRADAEQMGIMHEVYKKTVPRVVGRPGRLVEEGMVYLDGPEPTPLVGVGLRLNLTARGEVVVIGLMPGMPAYVGGVEVGDIITSVDEAPVWLPDEVARRVVGPEGSTVTLGLLRGPYRGEMEITLHRKFLGHVIPHLPEPPEL